MRSIHYASMMTPLQCPMANTQWVPDLWVPDSLGTMDLWVRLLFGYQFWVRYLWVRLLFGYGYSLGTKFGYGFFGYDGSLGTTTLWVPHLGTVSLGTVYLGPMDLWVRLLFGY
uniref:Uncharacterized protein n=1 Tax=Caenorhabditis japonica TaxID=281687 RepID=A0A8R1E955_CAEJA